MHIAPNITIRNRRSGGHWKITEVVQGAVTLTDPSGKAYLRLQLAEVPLDFEEFGPLYPAYGVNEDGDLAPPPMVHLERCPFCGSTNLDPAAWMSDADLHNTGPGCDDCGATCESVGRWNDRHTPVTPEVRAFRTEWRQAIADWGTDAALKAFDKEFMV